MLFALLSALLCPFFRAYSEDVREALRMAGISHKAAALDMGISESHLNEQLNGVGHLSMRRIARLPANFHQWLSVIRARRVGVPKELRVGQHIRAARVAMRQEHVR